MTDTKFDVIRSPEGGCCICSKNDQELFLARQADTGQMAAVCSCCLLHRIDDYLIDNTRPWPVGEKSEDS